MSRHSENSRMEEEIGNHPLFYVHLGAPHTKFFKDGFENMRVNRISFSTTPASGLTFTATSARGRHRLVEGVGALCNYYGRSIEFQLDSSSFRAGNINSISGHLGLTKQFSPSTTAEVVLSFLGHTRTKFKLMFRHQHAAFLMSAASGLMHRISLSATSGTPNITYGFKMEVARILEMIWFPRWEAAFQVTRPTWDAYVILEFDKFKASYVHYLDEAKKIAVGIMMPVNFVQHKIDFIATGSCAIDDTTSVMAQIDRRVMLETHLLCRINEKAHLMVSAEFRLQQETWNWAGCCSSALSGF